MLLHTDSPASSPSATPTTDLNPSAPATVVDPAGADGYGLPAGDGPAQIHLWTDLSCPYCRMLEEITGSAITDAVASGKATLTIHPLNFVSTAHQDATQWSTRAANALAAVLDAGEADKIPAFYALLQHNQTLSDGTSHPSDADILEIAKHVGITADISDAVATQRFGVWVAASNEHWLGTTIDGTTHVINGVPVLVIDGTIMELSSENLVADVQAAIDAAQG